MVYRIIFQNYKAWKYYFIALCEILRKIGKIRKMGKMKNFQKRGLDYFIHMIQFRL